METMKVGIDKSVTSHILASKDGGVESLISIKNEHNPDNQSELSSNSPNAFFLDKFSYKEQPTYSQAQSSDKYQYNFERALRSPRLVSSRVTRHQSRQPERNRILPKPGKVNPGSALEILQHISLSGRDHSNNVPDDLITPEQKNRYRSSESTPRTYNEFSRLARRKLLSSTSTKSFPCQDVPKIEVHSCSDDSYVSDDSDDSNTPSSDEELLLSPKKFMQMITSEIHGNMSKGNFSRKDTIPDLVEPSFTTPTLKEKSTDKPYEVQQQKKQLQQQGFDPQQEKEELLACQTSKYKRSLPNVGMTTQTKQFGYELTSSVTNHRISRSRNQKFVPITPGVVHHNSKEICVPESSFKRWRHSPLSQNATRPSPPKLRFGNDEQDIEKAQHPQQLDNKANSPKSNGHLNNPEKLQCLTQYTHDLKQRGVFPEQHQLQPSFSMATSECDVVQDVSTPHHHQHQTFQISSDNRNNPLKNCLMKKVSKERGMEQHNSQKCCDESTERSHSCELYSCSKFLINSNNMSESTFSASNLTIEECDPSMVLKSVFQEYSNLPFFTSSHSDNTQVKPGNIVIALHTICYASTSNNRLLAGCLYKVLASKEGPRCRKDNLSHSMSSSTPLPSNTDPHEESSMVQFVHVQPCFPDTQHPTAHAMWAPRSCFIDMFTWLRDVMTPPQQAR
eukprot:gene10599-2722_t